MRPSRFHDVELRRDESVDEFMDGRLRLIQSARGYRFSIDAVLLSEFVTVRPGDLVVDLGTGCGIISLILLLTRPAYYVVGLEIQPHLAEAAIRNAILNGFKERMGVVLGDIRHPPLAQGKADVVVCNPPYRPRNSGRLNPASEKAIARHELLASLDDILKTAHSLLKPRGKLAIIFPVARLADVVQQMRRFGLEPKRMRVIYPGMKSEAKLVLVEGSRGGKGGLKVLPPLVDRVGLSISNGA
jgi:tRNA1Val (adenine37-N6)-methyltransferase